MHSFGRTEVKINVRLTPDTLHLEIILELGVGDPKCGAFLFILRFSTGGSLDEVTA
jgi:hypothetical protein